MTTFLFGGALVLICIGALVAAVFLGARAKGQDQAEDRQARNDAKGREVADAEERRIDRLPDQSVFDELRQYQRDVPPRPGQPHS